MATVTISVSVHWVGEDPDGSVCECCKEPCLLVMDRLVIKANEMVTKTDCVFCGSCREMIEYDEED